MKRRILLFLAALLPILSLDAGAQSVRNSSYQTIAHIKSDGTVQDGSYRTIGYVKGNGTVQDGSYRTIGYTDGVPYRWAAWFFFFG